MNWELRIAPSARKRMKRMADKDKRLVHTALSAMRTDPRSGHTEQLTHHLYPFKRRVGSWRILFDIDPAQQIVEIHDILRRTTTTYKKRR